MTDISFVDNFTIYYSISLFTGQPPQRRDCAPNLRPGLPSGGIARQVGMQLDSLVRNRALPAVLFLLCSVTTEKRKTVYFLAGVLSNETHNARTKFQYEHCHFKFNLLCPRTKGQYCRYSRLCRWGWYGEPISRESGVQLLHFRWSA